ncbi:Asp-tRNA(Asn)/Glu-tRNA(Gln) amidotransferase subunit GatB [Sphingobacteriales bacterium UPWRP_1]|nr:glutaminyl-tRNA synthase (glutamine-hydrolyzing) subunit B [Sphingobacteriales bacterium TSM_CSM]PSJ78203.1 Asp-tRNA(Asn)/Glu-tRNA(Gln) amidotransferase subunit GatB [Sphingobacteriales bacterium UPWRP_1]
MSSANSTNQYDIVIGLEVHAQLTTESKIFAPDATAFGAAPNTQVSYITLAHPGTLPFLNQKVPEYAVMLGLATNCTIQTYNEFSRKNYFYADLPKGYQISQYDTPICYNGHLDITVNNAVKRIRINRIHMEEDAGKSIHDQNPQYSYIDLNRAGVPLLEIVTEPDLNSPDEAQQYVAQLRQLVQYLGVCDGNMEEGSLRCDVNISVKPKGQTQLGQRVEVKNLNSLRNVKRAIEFESNRQIALLQQGQYVQRETRSFDANNGTTFPLRSKELEHDYRYFPEPDLQPLYISEAYIAAVKHKMPRLPKELVEQFTGTFGLSLYDATVLTDSKETALFYLETIQHTGLHKAVANWLMGPVKAFMNNSGKTAGSFPVPAKRLAQLVELTDSGAVSFSVAAQELLPAMVQQPEIHPKQLAEQLELLVQTDNNALLNLIEQVLQQYPDKVKEYKKGKKGLLGFFVGQVTRLSTTKLDPQAVNNLLAERLNNA